ncbi:hypothetical protein FNH09_38115 [Streptomyces adustus]|uniref:Uncharacterized protein n=1 Tax=Streptomyces adustus TaxID=1609272 RepID=A0A5N8VP93_9ACTN|nr:hypothetical protein [Streptomyces adustus]MPY36829.1 hypothetical protein [Streptomyces adustus]
MDEPVIVLDGYLDDQTLPDDLHGTTAAFQLVVSPTDKRIDELVMPCQTADPALAHAALHELGASDLLRVTGHLRLPRAPGDGMRLHVTAIAVLESGCELASVATDDDLAPEALSEVGVIERYGAYQVWHDPDTGRSSVWHTTGCWVGDTDPAGLGTAITAHETTSPRPDHE